MREFIWRLQFWFSFFVKRVTQKVTKCKFNSSWCLSGCLLQCFSTAVKDICTINTFEKLRNILFSEAYCWYFGFTTLLFSATITDMSLYELLNLFPCWPLVFRSFLLPLLVGHDVVTLKFINELWSFRPKDNLPEVDLPENGSRSACWFNFYL